MGKSGVKKPKQQEMFNPRQIATLKELADYIDEPVLKRIKNTDVSQEMLENLKQTPPNPVFVSTIPVPPPPKESQWRNAEERCQHTFKAVRESLKVMRNIRYHVGTTGFAIQVLCEGFWRTVNVSFNGTKHGAINFHRRSGVHVNKEFTNTTQAAAEAVAVVMYYATR